MARAFRYDGLLPHVTELTPALVEQMRAAADAARDPGARPYDIVVEDVTPGHDPAAAAAKVRPYAEAGATWWIESPWEYGDDHDRMLERLRAGPPTT
jgi:hypothetical protein